MNALVVAYLLRCQMAVVIDSMPRETQRQHRRRPTAAERQALLTRWMSRVGVMSESARLPVAEAGLVSQYPMAGRREPSRSVKGA